MPITYRDAGVDIDAGESTVARIAPLAAATKRPGVLGGLGGFGALFALNDAGRWNDPVLVSATDGVLVAKRAPQGPKCPAGCQGPEGASPLPHLVSPLPSVASHSPVWWGDG